MDKQTRWKRDPTVSPLLPDDSVAEADRGERAPGDTGQETRDNAIPAQRVWLMLAIFLLIVAAMIARMAYWAAAGSSMSGPPPDRGVPVRSRVVDRNGLLLATDSFSWEVYARPLAIKKDTRHGPTLPKDIATSLGQPVETIQAGLAVTLSLITLAKNMTETQRLAIDALEQPSLVWTEARRVRAYPQGSLAAHVIGFVNYAREGLYGVEASYNDWLLGLRDLPAEQQAQGGAPVPDGWQVYLPSPGRHDLILYFDAPLQHSIERRLAEAISTTGSESGTIIVMDPRNGSILALANYPTFDLNRYSEAKPERWANAAVTAAYEPGSVFKLVTMAAALDTGQIAPESVYQDTGTIVVDGQAIHNAETKSYGKVTVKQVLAKSLNVVTARICLDMGAETFYRYVRQFGFGSLTEVDLNLETPGVVKEPGHPYWSRFDQAANSFGQALTVTPLQMINAVAAIANGGTRFQPQVVRALVQNGQIYELSPHMLSAPIKPETARVLTQMMVYTVDSSAYANFVPGYRVAGKTGTAEISTAKGYTSPETITSFVGFLPAADPQIVILVKLDKPKTSRWAEQVVVPVFGKVAQDAVRILKIAPDNRAP